MTRALKYLPLTVAGLLCLLFVRLGWWQLDRAEEKQQLLEAFAAGAQAPPRALERYVPQPRYTPVRIRGRFLDYRVLLDNQIRERRLGVHVFTLFEPAGGPPDLLVNRGWHPLAADRRVLGVIPPAPAGTVELTGLLSSPPRPGIRLGEVDYLAAPPRLLPYIEPQALATALKTKIAPQILLLSANTDPDPGGDTLIRDWTLNVMPSQRHRGYAWQWFSLAATVALVTLVLSIRRKQ